MNFCARYQAGSWECARRVVVRVAWHAGELFPRVGFILTNLKWHAKKVAYFYNRKGTAEQWIKEDGAPNGAIAVSKAEARLRGCLPEPSADWQTVRAEEWLFSVIRSRRTSSES